MSATVLDPHVDQDDLARRLRRLATTAAPALAVRPDLADLVLDQARAGRRRRRTRAVAAGGALLILGGVAAAAVPGHGAFVTVVQPSGSMQPTIAIGERVVLDRRLAPQRLEVVRAHVEGGGDGPAYDTFGRVVGLPGETVSCPADASGGCSGVEIDGVRLEEPYLSGPTAPFAAVRVPADGLFLLGDARDLANDSRSIGPLPLTRVTGVAVRVIAAEDVARPVTGSPDHAAPGGADVLDPADPVPPARSGAL